MNQLHKDIISAIECNDGPVSSFDIAKALNCERSMVGQSINYINKYTTRNVNRVMGSDKRLRYWIES